MSSRCPNGAGAAASESKQGGILAGKRTSRRALNRTPLRIISGAGDGSVAADQLRLFIERIERVKEEIKGLNDDVRDIYAEAKANGYDASIMKEIVKLRAMETHTRQERDAILETYRQALGLA